MHALNERCRSVAAWTLNGEPGHSLKLTGDGLAKHTVQHSLLNQGGPGLILSAGQNASGSSKAVG